jgi:hypothetical protein
MNAAIAELFLLVGRYESGGNPDEGVIIVSRLSNLIFDLSNS